MSSSKIWICLTGGDLTPDERSEAAEIYGQSLEHHFGSAAAVIAAMRATDPAAVERWTDAALDARVDAVGGHTYTDDAEFQIRVSEHKR